MISLDRCNPYLRVAMIQNHLTEGCEPRIPFDHRVFFIYEGRGVIWLNGEERPLEPSSLIFLGIRDSYYFKGSFRAAVLNFDMTMACCERKDAICPVPARQYDASLVFDQTAVEGLDVPAVFIADAQTREFVDQLVSIYIRGEANSAARCSAYLKLLLSDILTQKPEIKHDRAQLARRLLCYIKDNLATLEGNRALGEHFGYHPVYLAKLFREQTGKTLHAAITEERLRVASRLLTYTNDSVEEIALRAGFPSRNHFCTAFKHAFGCTPLTYRGKYRLGLE